MLLPVVILFHISYFNDMKYENWGGEGNMPIKRINHSSDKRQAIQSQYLQVKWQGYH